MLKKTTLTALLLLAVLVSNAQNITIDTLGFKKVIRDSANVTFTVNRPDSIEYKFQLSTNPNFTGVTVFTNWIGRKGAGVITKGLIVPDSAVSWVRIISRDSANTYDTSAIIKMIRKPKVTAVLTATTNAISAVITADGGNLSSVMPCILGLNATFSSYSQYASYTLTGNYPLTFNDTVPYVLASNKMYWLKFIVTSPLGNDTFVQSITTLPTPQLPTVAISGVSVTDTSMTASIVVDVFGSPTSTGILHWKLVPVGPFKDSVVTMFPANSVGPKTISVKVGGLKSNTKIYWYYEARNNMGSTLSSNQTTTTLVAFGLSMDTAYVNAAKDSIAFILGYANATGLNNSFDGTVAIEKDGIIIDHHSYTNYYGAGTTKDAFAIADTGTYKIYGWGSDYPNGTTRYTDTLTVVVTKSTTGVITITQTHPLVVYPNPATDILHIKNVKEYMLVDLTGKLLTSGSIPEDAEAKVSISGFSKGIYILKTEKGNRQIVIE